MKNKNWFIFMIFGKSKKFTMFSSIIVQYHSISLKTPPVIYEQFLIVESIENFWQNLNLRPRTNPMKAMTRNPSNVDQPRPKYLVTLHPRDISSNIAPVLVTLRHFNHRLKNFPIWISCFIVTRINVTRKLTVDRHLSRSCNLSAILSGLDILYILFWSFDNKS